MSMLDVQEHRFHWRQFQVDLLADKNVSLIAVTLCDELAFNKDNKQWRGL